MRKRYIILGDEKGVALLTVITIIFILLVLSATMLNLMSNQTRIVEHDISKVKSKYATEAVMVRELERLRRWNTTETSHPVSGRYDQSGTNWSVDVSSGTVPSGGLAGLTELNITVDYAPTF